MERLWNFFCVNILRCETTLTVASDHSVHSHSYWSITGKCRRHCVICWPIWVSAPSWAIFSICEVREIMSDSHLHGVGHLSLTCFQGYSDSKGSNWQSTGCDLCQNCPMLHYSSQWLLFTCHTELHDLDLSWYDLIWPCFAWVFISSRHFLWCCLCQNLKYRWCTVIAFYVWSYTFFKAAMRILQMHLIVSIFKGDFIQYFITWRVSKYGQFSSDFVNGGTWQTIRQRFSPSVFCRRPLWQHCTQVGAHACL